MPIEKLPNVIVVAGLTGSGKTSFAINCVVNLRNKGIHAEIVNADAFQQYNELKIITAYPTSDELKRATHNLYGILAPHESSSVANWLVMAENKINELNCQNKIAILCGGSGLYINALLGGFAKIPDIPKSFRQDILNKFYEIGAERFFSELCTLDSESTRILHPNDVRRVLRAYEVVAYTKKPLAEWWRNSSSLCNYNVKSVILHPEREKLKERCLLRINNMIKNGAIEEVEDFLIRYPGYAGALSDVIGFDQICRYINGEISQEKCVNDMSIRTNQYSKRQSTWFRNQMKYAKVVYAFGGELEPNIILS